MKDTRTVARGIGITDENGKYRVETDPDAIAGMYSQEELDGFVKDGVLVSDNPEEWKSTKVSESEAVDESESAKDSAGKSAGKQAKK